jgi:small-conductance mechanosensitive channel
LHWLQNYSAFDHRLGLTALVASSPICFLLWSLSLKRVKGYVAAGLTLLFIFIVAVFGYGMPARAALSAAVLGMVSGLRPIGWIILTNTIKYSLVLLGFVILVVLLEAWVAPFRHTSRNDDGALRPLGAGFGVTIARTQAA